MLVLSRKVGEEIFIGDDIVLIISKIEEDKVRIAISAPREVPIFRGELIRKQKRNAPDAIQGD